MQGDQLAHAVNFFSAQQLPALGSSGETPK